MGETKKKEEDICEEHLRNVIRKSATYYMYFVLSYRVTVLLFYMYYRVPCILLSSRNLGRVVVSALVSHAGHREIESISEWTVFHKIRTVGPPYTNGYLVSSVGEIKYGLGVVLAASPTRVPYG